MENLRKTLPHDKVKINWNKKPIKMSLFLSFLTIGVEKSTNHLGASNGWTERYNREHDLIVRGGIVKGTEYLDSIQYGKKLANGFNNFVNPFYLKDIMTEEGVRFFVKYYEENIKDVLSKQKNKAEKIRKDLNNAIRTLEALQSEYKSLKKYGEK